MQSHRRITFIVRAEYDLVRTGIILIAEASELGEEPRLGATSPACYLLSLASRNDAQVGIASW
jgi:hypothetical protein